MIQNSGLLSSFGLLNLFLICPVIGLFGISLGGIFSSIFGGKGTLSEQNASKSAEAERKHQLLMAKEATELAKLKAVQAEAQSKKTLLYVGIGGGLFMVMMFMMMRK